MRASLQGEVGARLRSEIIQVAAVSGGCISEAFHCHLRDGREVFVKVQEQAPKDFFALESEGLRWLAEAEALATPSVLCHGSEYLVLEYLAPAAPIASYDEELGRGLAQLHSFGTPSFGWHKDNYLATLPQHNDPEKCWSDFYAEHRLRPLVKRLVDEGDVPPIWNRRFESLFRQLPDLVGPEESPSRLHGDLWSGNLHTTNDGRPSLIDPAVYGGHREMDLAMLQLFGSPSSVMFAAYDEVMPRSSGHEDRTALYQLYPLLAHVALFGGSYVRACEDVLARWC